MLERINKGRCPTVEDFCRDYEVKERTVHEDIRFLKEDLGYKIEHDRFRGGYVNRDPGQQLPKFELTDGELFALTLGKDMLAEYSGTAFEPILATAIDKITERLPDRLRLDLAELYGAVRFKASGVATISRKTFFDLNRASEKKNVVQITYFSASDGQMSIREIEPLRIVENRGAWYAISWCRMRSKIRTFAIHRIQDYKILPEEFADREGVDVDARLNEAFQLEHGDPVQKYVIKFDITAARYIRERTWHPSQELVEHPDGTCTLSFTATRLDEVKRWVLLYGSCAEVIEPIELRQVLKEEFTKAAKVYQGADVVAIEKSRKNIAASTAKKKGSKLYSPKSKTNSDNAPSVAE